MNSQMRIAGNRAARHRGSAPSSFVGDRALDLCAFELLSFDIVAFALFEDSFHRGAAGTGTPASGGAEDLRGQGADADAVRPLVPLASVRAAFEIAVFGSGGGDAGAVEGVAVAAAAGVLRGDGGLSLRGPSHLVAGDVF